MTAGGVILARGMQNVPSPDALVTEYMAEQQAVIARIGGKPLSESEFPGLKGGA